MTRFLPNKVVTYPCSGADIFPCLLCGNIEIARQPEIADSVNDPEIDRLCRTAHMRLNFFKRHAEHLRRGKRVYIVAAFICLNKLFTARKMREQPQLDLGIVGVYKNPFRRSGDEQFAQFAPLVVPDGDVLQIGVRAGEPPRGRHDLIEICMHEFIRRADKRAKAFDVG